MVVTWMKCAPRVQVLSSKLHKLWRRFDKRVMQRLFGGRDTRMPVYFQSVAELNHRILVAPPSPSGASFGDGRGARPPHTSHRRFSTPGHMPEALPTPTSIGSGAFSAGLHRLECVGTRCSQTAGLNVVACAVSDTTAPHACPSLRS